MTQRMPDLDWRHPQYQRWRNLNNDDRSAYMQEWRKIGDEKGFYVPTICDRWRGDGYQDDGFKNFVSDIGDPPPGKTVLARHNLAQDWKPSNVYWTTRREVFILNKTRPIGWRAWAPKEMVEKIDKQMLSEALEAARKFKI
jgi:hypothetical protein